MHKIKYTEYGQADRTRPDKQFWSEHKNKIESLNSAVPKVYIEQMREI